MDDRAADLHVVLIQRLALEVARRLQVQGSGDLVEQHQEPAFGAGELDDRCHDLVEDLLEL